jgi:hypothetical protein
MMSPGGSVRDPVLEETVAEPSLSALMAQLTSDARDVARAEIGLQKAKFGELVGRYRAAAAYFAIAGVLALAALIALLVGLILSISTLIGPGLATVAVTGVTLAIAATLAFIAKSRLAPRPAK